MLEATEDQTPTVHHFGSEAHDDRMAALEDRIARLKYQIDQHPLNQESRMIVDYVEALDERHQEQIRKINQVMQTISTIVVIVRWVLTGSAAVAVVWEAFAGHSK